MLAAEKDQFRALRERFVAAWPDLVDEIVSDPTFKSMPDAVQWLENVLRKTVPKGKQNRAMAAVSFYRQLVQDVTPEEERLSFIIGWLMEIGQAAALMADDIMDESETRRGESCWYRESDVGMSAVNDALLLENICYFIYYKYFSDKEYFHDLMALGHDLALKTIMGQSIDTRLALTFSMDECTMEKYARIVKYKTSYYTFYYPYACALITAGVKDKEVFERMEEISVEMGHLFQIQDDYLDLYGNPATTGKIGTDIIDQKCTWLLVTALENASPAQKETLKICYGSKMQDDEDMVKSIYKDLKIKERFRAFEKESYKKIGDKIMGLPSSIPQAPLMTLLNAIYRRNK